MENFLDLEAALTALPHGQTYGYEALGGLDIVASHLGDVFIIFLSLSLLGQKGTQEYGCENGHAQSQNETAQDTACGP